MFWADLNPKKKLSDLNSSQQYAFPPQYVDGIMTTLAKRNESDNFRVDVYLFFLTKVEPIAIYIILEDF